MDSDRERLAELLSVAPGEIAASAREAQVTGATFKLWPGASTASQFRSVFRRRQRNAFRAGRPSIGFAEGLRDLGAYEGVFLALGYVDDRPQGGYYFQLFLTPDRSRLVTCWGVKPSARAAEQVLDRHRPRGRGLERRSTADRDRLLAMLAPLCPAEIRRWWSPRWKRERRV
ncbi:hypothetical protein AB0383_33540 [Amycolatopsis sp. NPDC051373]|uniref:hypothetical protein n=1 Tax=Amycolatopsis sp. NPDC051373 TaxID=3155801 RepID=UPI00344E9959